MKPQLTKYRVTLFVAVLITILGLSQTAFAGVLAATPSRTPTSTKTSTPTQTPTLSATERTQTQIVKATDTAYAKETRIAGITQTAEIRYAAATATREEIDAQRTRQAESIQQTMAPFTATAEFKAEYKKIQPLELSDHADAYEGEKVTVRVLIYDFNFLYEKTFYGFLYGSYKSVFVKPADWSSVRNFRSYDIVTVYGVVRSDRGSPWLIDAVVTR
jgi:hypothetical protein